MQRNKGKWVGSEWRCRDYMLPTELWSHFWPNSDCRDFGLKSACWPNCCEFWRAVSVLPYDPTGQIGPSDFQLFGAEGLLAKKSAIAQNERSHLLKG